MFAKLLIALVAAFTMTVSMAPEANAWNLGSRSRISVIETASAATAYQPLCLDYPSECRKSRRTIMAYTATVRALLVLARAQINLVTAPPAAAERSCRVEFQGLDSTRLEQLV